MRDCLRSASRLRAHPATQLAVTGALSALVGFTLQITKLSALDSSGRQFDQGTYAGKVSFLAVFGVSKAMANLSVGWLVTRMGYLRTELAGWLLGLVMPLTLALAATATESGVGDGASGAAGWRAVMGANVVLGLQQGLCWSVTVLVMILLMPDSRRGLASGLNETLGYAAVASAAPVYGILESRMVRCGWALPAAQLSAACRAAAAAPSPPATAGPSAQSPPPLDPHSCTSPDTWDPACLGECQCRGYDRLLVAALLVLLPTGLAVTALLLAEPSPAAAAAAEPRLAYLPVSSSAAMAEKEEEEEEEDQGTGNDGKLRGSPSGVGGNDVVLSANRDVETGIPSARRRGPRSLLAALRQALARSTDGMSYSQLPPAEHHQGETRRLLPALGAPPGEAGQFSSAGDPAALTEEAEAARGGAAAASIRQSRNGGVQRGAASPDSYELLPAVGSTPTGDNRAAATVSHAAAADGARPDVAAAAAAAAASAAARKAAAAPPAAFEVALSGPSAATTADRRWRRADGLAGASGGGAASSSAAIAASGGGTSEMLASARSFGCAFLHYTWMDASTAAMCLAGVTSNALTSLAWGLLLTWARDGLGVPGPGRNLLTAAYSFLKGLVQLLSGAVSDAAGRKAPVLTGLALNAAGLLTCACGAGWGGRLLGGMGARGGEGGGGGQEEEAVAQRLLLVQFGYLMLGSCLMGAGAGVFYPVMPAAMVDHHQRQHRHQGPRQWRHHQRRPPHQAGTGGGGGGAGGGTARFWRDLGYALGALGGPVADVAGVEVTLVVAAGVCLAVAGVVLLRYEERVPGAVPAGAVVGATVAAAQSGGRKAGSVATGRGGASSGRL